MEAVDITGEDTEINEESGPGIELVHDLLGLLSTGTIEALTSFSGGGKRDPLVDALVNYLDLDSKKSGEQKVGKAKILPFKKEKKVDTENLGNSTSSFIFKEKKRAEKINKKVKGKEIIELYQKSSQVNVKQERALRDDLSKSYKVGVLVNKRQF